MFNWRLFEKLSEPLWMLFFFFFCWSCVLWILMILCYFKRACLPIWNFHLYSRMCAAYIRYVLSDIHWEMSVTTKTKHQLSHGSQQRQWNLVPGCLMKLTTLLEVSPASEIFDVQWRHAVAHHYWLKNHSIFFFINIYPLWYLCPCCFGASLVTSLCLQWS